MRTTLDRLKALGRSNDPEAIHRLRVALRRCRTLAVVMGSIDPDPAWDGVRKKSRRLFRQLGRLRDAQVLAEGVRRITPHHDDRRRLLLKRLRREEDASWKKVRRAAKRFDRQAWKRLTRAIDVRAGILRPDDLAAQALALEHLEKVETAHRRALASDRADLWHELRIALKGFRYTVESLLPAHFATWASGLRAAQDLLGDLHDRHVLASFLRDAAPRGSADLHRRIHGERRVLVERYRRRVAGRRGLLQTWRRGLPSGAGLQTACTARMLATARAVDAHPEATASIGTLALRLLSALEAAPAGLRHDVPVREILRVSAAFSGLRAHGTRRRIRAADAIIEKIRTPAAERGELLRSLVPLVVGFHRGREPRRKEPALARLSHREREAVAFLSGLLRLARRLHQMGAGVPPGRRAEISTDGLRLCLRGVPDTRRDRRRLDRAKHALETCLGRPITLGSCD